MQTAKIVRNILYWYLVIKQVLEYFARVRVELGVEVRRVGRPHKVDFEGQLVVTVQEEFGNIFLVPHLDLATEYIHDIIRLIIINIRVSLQTFFIYTIFNIITLHLQ